VSILVSKTGDIRSSRLQSTEMHKDRCGLSQLYLRYASKVPRWYYWMCTVSIGGAGVFVVVKVGPAQPECMAGAIVV
jgi:hypothetical protein